MSGISGVGVSPGLAYAQQVQQMINNDNSHLQSRAGDSVSDKNGSSQSTSSVDAQAAGKVSRPEPVEKASPLAPLQEPGRINLYA